VVSYNPRMGADPVNPGPGTYRNRIKKNRLPASMRDRVLYNDPLVQAAKMDFPGPGNYQDAQ